MAKSGSLHEFYREGEQNDFSLPPIKESRNKYIGLNKSVNEIGSQSHNKSHRKISLNHSKLYIIPEAISRKNESKVFTLDTTWLD